MPIARRHASRRRRVRGTRLARRSRGDAASSAPIGMPSSAAQASSVFASGTTSVGAGDRAFEDLAGAAVDGDDVAGAEDTIADVDLAVADLEIRRRRPLPGSPSRAPRRRHGSPGRRARSGCRPHGPSRGRPRARSRRGRGSRRVRPRPRPPPPPGSWRSRPSPSPATPAARSRAASRHLSGRSSSVGGSASSGATRADRLGARQRERRVLGHVDRDPQRRLRAALADPHLEHPQPAVLDRELDVAQVGVVMLEPCRVLAQLGGDGRAGARRARRSARSRGSRPRRPRPGRRTARRRRGSARRSPGCA